MAEATGIRWSSSGRLVGPGCNGVGDHVNNRTSYTSSPVSAGIGDLSRLYHPGIYPIHSGPLSLAIPPWVGAVSTDDSFDHRCGRNSEFYVQWALLSGLLVYWLIVC